MTIAKGAITNSPTSLKTVSLMGRMGYGARGTIYLVVGISAALATFDPRHSPGGFKEALSFLQDHWAGSIVLVLLAIGVACFADWLAVSAIYRRDHPGWGHWVLVAGLLGDATIYFGFMVSLLGMIFGPKGSNEYVLQSWVSSLVAGIGGKIMVGLAARLSG